MTFAQLNDLQYLDLAELFEPEQNSLRLIVLEAKLSEEVTADAVAPPIPGAQPIGRSSDDRAFQIDWDSYIAYSVRDESYALNANGEQFEGRHFRLYSASRYLEFVAAATIASKIAPTPFRHWALVCLNHVIDVVSMSEPTVHVRAAV